MFDIYTLGSDNLETGMTIMPKHTSSNKKKISQTKIYWGAMPIVLESLKCQKSALSVKAGHLVIKACTVRRWLSP